MTSAGGAGLLVGACGLVAFLGILACTTVLRALHRYCDGANALRHASVAVALIPLGFVLSNVLLISYNELGKTLRDYAAGSPQGLSESVAMSVASLRPLVDHVGATETLWMTCFLFTTYGVMAVLHHLVDLLRLLKVSRRRLVASVSDTPQRQGAADAASNVKTHIYPFAQVLLLRLARMASDVRTVDLYGGAMRVKMGPALEDVSRFRQVPDNQEVYADADTGASLIVELLGRQREVSNADAGTFFYLDLAKDNGCPLEHIQCRETVVLPPSAYPQLVASAASPPTTSSVVSPQACDYACLTTGFQCVSKYANEEGKENEVFVGLAVFRFTSPVSTEILLSLSCPTQLHPESSETKVIQRLLTEQERLRILYTAVASLEIVAWDLFVPEETE